MVFAGLAMVVVIALLVGKSYLAQIELRESVLITYRHELVEQAEVLSSFYSERLNDLKNLPTKREISIFFENKALGMSMEYGLRASLIAIRENLDLVLKERILGKDRIYTRFVFIDSFGGVLVDTEKSLSSELQDINLLELLTPKPAILAEPLNGQAQLTVSTPYFFKGEYSGQIIAWISTDTVLKHVIPDHDKFSRDFLGVFARQGDRYFPIAETGPVISAILPQIATMGDSKWQRFNTVQPGGSQVEVLSVKVPIQGTPLILLGAIPTNKLFGYMAPWHLLAALGSLSILSLLGVGFVWRANNRNLILQTRLEEAAIREEEIAAKNLQLGEKINERRQAEEALRESEEKYRGLIETTNTGYVIIDTEGKVLDANQEYVRLTGYNEIKEILGRSVIEWTAEQDRGKNAAAVEQCLKTGLVKHLELDYTGRNGRSIPVEINATAISTSEGVKFLSLVRDISDRKRDEDEKAKLEAQLVQSQKMEAIGTLAGGVAHDFNNILGAILGFTDLTLQSVPGDSQEYSNLSQVLKAGERARDLVKQILVFSRRTAQVRKPLQVSSIIEEALKLVRASLPSTIEIQQNLAAPSALVLADPTQIHQILMNLGSNAAHAMRENGGLLEINLAEVNLDRGDPGQHPDLTPGPYVRLTVRDTGQGMDQEVMGRIFEPFFTTKEVGEGTGMGLAVVHGIVKSSGGEITVSSRPGQGTTFTILLPKVAGEVATALTSPAPLPTGGDSILFIDDEEMLVDMTKEMLKKLGYKVVAQTNGLEALKLFQAQPDKFDLVITDQTMPHMTGIQLAQELRHLRPDIPIILCTGYSEKVSAENIKATEINELLMKPIFMSKLAETIRKVLD